MDSLKMFILLLRSLYLLAKHKLLLRCYWLAYPVIMWLQYGWLLRFGVKLFRLWANTYIKDLELMKSYLPLSAEQLQAGKEVKRLLERYQ